MPIAEPPPVERHTLGRVGFAAERRRRKRFDFRDVRRRDRCRSARVNDRERGDLLVQTRFIDNVPWSHRLPVTRVADVLIPGLRLTSPTAELAEQFLTWRHRPDVTMWFLQQRIEDPAEYVA